jgi:hypothetical protein
MNRSSLAVVLVMLLALVSFTSLPVVAELPWDADNNDGPGNSDTDAPIDTSIHDPGNIKRTFAPGGPGIPGWWLLLSPSYNSPLLFINVIGVASTVNSQASTSADVKNQNDQRLTN